MRVYLPIALATLAIVALVLLVSGCGGHGSGY
jgi:hypothetical protein